MVDEAGDVDYAVHVQRQEGHSEERRVESTKTIPVSSTPKLDAGPSSIQLDKKMVVK